MAKDKTKTVIFPKVQVERGSEVLKSYRLQTKECRIEVKRCRSNVWRLRITEPASTVSDIHFSAEGEVCASIDTD